MKNDVPRLAELAVTHHHIRRLAIQLDVIQSKRQRFADA
jgi:hypothetical protein